jgi:hypothetical protein
VADWIAWTILSALLLPVGYFAIRGAMSPPRPLPILLTAWQLAVGWWWWSRKIVLAVALLVVVGASMQFYFVNTSGHDQWTLLIASIFWQAFMATFVAALAVPLHLFVIHVYLQAPVADPSEGGRKLAPLMLRAAAYGLAIWILGYLLGVAAKAVILVMGPSPVVNFGLAFISFLTTSLLVLVRPSLSLGMPRPLRTGIGMGWKRALPLYVMMAMLAIPPTVLTPLAIFVPPAFLRPGLRARLISITLISILNIFQYLATEIATVLFARRAAQHSRDEADEAAGAGLKDLSIPTSRWWRTA